MKKVFSLLVIAMTMSFAGMNASAATSGDRYANLVENIWSALPRTLVVKQEATLADGRSVTIFYKKSGDQCEVYTSANVKDFTIDDLTGLKKSSFERVSSVEGRKIFTAPFSKVRNIFKGAAARYL